MERFLIFNVRVLESLGYSRFFLGFRRFYFLFRCVFRFWFIFYKDIRGLEG